jgi:sugar phosphate isomerase/epimerase
MTRSAVTVSLVPETRGGPFIFWDNLPSACSKAKALGFDAVEIFVPDAKAVDPKLLSKLLGDHGLSLAAVGTGAGWVKHRLHLCLPDEKARKQARRFICAMIDFGGHFNAPAIVGSMQGRSGDGVDHETALGYVADALEELGEHASQYRVSVLFEPLNRYETNLVNTIDAGMQLLESLSTRFVSLLADLFHMNIEETNLPSALRAGIDYVSHVHFVDSNRRPAGLGHIDFAPIAEVLTAVRYEGYASAEALPYPDPDAAASQTMKAFRQYFPR